MQWNEMKCDDIVVHDCTMNINYYQGTKLVFISSAATCWGLSTDTALLTPEGTHLTWMFSPATLLPHLQQTLSLRSLYIHKTGCVNLEVSMKRPPDNI